MKPMVTRMGKREEECYSLERQAEFLLSNAIDEADYAQAREAVRKMGLDPDHVSQYKKPETN